MDKKKLSERDICTKIITPAIKNAGWDIETQIREEVRLTKGRIIVRGKLVARGKEKRADYVLYYKPNIPIAVIEAKDNKHSLSDGMQQAVAYADMLGVPFAYSSNGDGFWENDRSGSSNKIERGLSLSGLPSPDELWKRYCQWKGIDKKAESIVLQDYHVDINAKEPRYYQLNAINRTIEAIAKGQNRVLLVMATGTGKTFTAFQIIWRLWKARKKKRILYLADRNILIDQTIVNDFKPFGSVMAKLTPKNKTIEKDDGEKVKITSAFGGERKVNKSYEIYLSLYQAIVGREGQEPVYKQFSPDFFDLIIVDECHRGSAAEDSAWREILEYFSSATQIGMTATPKETTYISNIDYFQTPVYSYSLKQGIEDGFLAPYKVVRIDFDKDLSGWRPEKGKLDKYGAEILDRIYNQTDFDRDLVLDKRTQLVAQKITEFLKNTDRKDKTIVFCEDIDHAERMRHALINENPDLVLEDSKYIMQITGDNEEGKDQLDNFIDPEIPYPVIVTTSRLMSTGVDSQTCKLIVLDRRIQSMTEFKQIIGRGTRVHEDYKKFFFTIMDFKKATELFADPEFDGEPVQIYEPGPTDDPVPPDNPNEPGPETFGDPIPDDGDDDTGEGGETGKQRKYYVDDVEVRVAAERVQYYDKDGKLITESLKDYTRKAILKEYRSLDDFLRRWNGAEKKEAIIEELREQGLLLEALEDDVGKGFGAFDLICHVAFDQPPLTRRERAENVRKRNYFTKYGEKAKAVLDALLEKYADGGIENLEDPAVLRVSPFDHLGTPVELVKAFGGTEKYINAIHELEQALYQKKA
jgi:type I restriction enzyme R subunit